MTQITEQQIPLIAPEEQTIPRFLVVEANVRFWEDATVNGKEDLAGLLIPLRSDKQWTPVIDLNTGIVQDWPNGTIADIHYKVCDEGRYWLANSNREKIAEWRGSYVPDHLLCIGDCGFGDYIILSINEDGHIAGWVAPTINGREWKDV